MFRDSAKIETESLLNSLNLGGYGRRFKRRFCWGIGRSKASLNLGWCSSTCSCIKCLKVAGACWGWLTLRLGTWGLANLSALPCWINGYAMSFSTSTFFGGGRSIAFFWVATSWTIWGSAFCSPNLNLRLCHIIIAANTYSDYYFLGQAGLKSNRRPFCSHWAQTFYRPPWTGHDWTWPSETPCWLAFSTSQAEFGLDLGLSPSCQARVVSATNSHRPSPTLQTRCSFATR